MTALAPAQALSATAPAVSTSAAAGSGSGFSFADLLDVINPLQHIPVVSTLYRAITGDTVKPLEQLAGDTLYGGLIGFAASAANFVFKDITGKDVGDTVLAFLEGKGGGDTQPTAVAGTAGAAPERIASGPPRALIVSNPATVIPAQATAVSPVLSDPAAFMAALNDNKVDPALARRALAAYRTSLNLDLAGTTQP